MKSKNFLSIQFKIILLIALVLVSMMVFVLYFINDNQKSNLMRATDRGIYLNSETLITTMKNMMLDGRAPLLVRSLEELRNQGGYKAIAIYRTNGVMAFSDYQTLDFVNTHQKVFHFDKTPRIKDSRTEEEKRLVTGDIRDAMNTLGFKEEFYNKTKELEYFFLTENQAECMRCHGSEYPYRGAVNFRLSVAGTYKQIDRTRNFLVLFFISVGTILLAVLIFFLRNLIVLPLIKIGGTIQKLVEGNFKARIDLKSRDELGNLADQINIMIKGLEERFMLNKYVSSSTRSEVAGGEETGTHTKKENITVLFSNVRGFTSYTETHPAEEVVKNLNKILEIQAEAIEKFGGDIDKFVGDEIMALFGDESSALHCAGEMIGKVSSLDLGLEIGIGINTGEVLAGNIGSKDRQEYAVIGDTVNVASRLCSLANAGDILISESVYKKISTEVQAELQKGRSIKGKKELIDVYLVKSIK